jgi:hypothetical protein
MTDNIETPPHDETIAQIARGLTGMIEDRQRWLASCERMIELLQPEWDRFEARAGHDLFVSRDYANHTSEARKHRKEIDLLTAARTYLQELNP